MKMISFKYFLFFQGIGLETARALATTNAHVFITARDMNRGAQVVEDIKKTTGNNQIDVLELDLTSLQSVRNCVNQFRAHKLPINILICKFTSQKHSN
jgi:short-subunit dehydrogenase